METSRRNLAGRKTLQNRGHIRVGNLRAGTRAEPARGKPGGNLRNQGHIQVKTSGGTSPGGKPQAGNPRRTSPRETYSRVIQETSGGTSPGGKPPNPGENPGEPPGGTHRVGNSNRGHIRVKPPGGTPPGGKPPNPGENPGGTSGRTTRRETQTRVISR